MALSGVHYVVGYAANIAGARGVSTLPAGIVGSQTMAAGATSTVVAPADGCLGSVNASAAIFYAYGPTPDATNGPRRYYDPASSPREDFILKKGDLFAWVAA